jgi:hypothetical protein
MRAPARGGGPQEGSEGGGTMSGWAENRDRWHDDGPDYDAVLLAVQEREEAKLAAEIGDSDEDGDWSLTDVLTARGYTHHAVGEPGNGIRSVCWNGSEVFRGRAGECWAWLETQERETQEREP